MVEKQEAFITKIDESFIENVVSAFILHGNQAFVWDEWDSLSPKNSREAGQKHERKSARRTERSSSDRWSVLRTIRRVSLGDGTESFLVKGLARKTFGPFGLVLESLYGELYKELFESLLEIVSLGWCSASSPEFRYWPSHPDSWPFQKCFSIPLRKDRPDGVQAVWTMGSHQATTSVSNAVSLYVKVKKPITEQGRIYRYVSTAADRAVHRTFR